MALWALATCTHVSRAGPLTYVTGSAAVPSIQHPDISYVYWPVRRQPRASTCTRIFTTKSIAAGSGN